MQSEISESEIKEMKFDLSQESNVFPSHQNLPDWSSMSFDIRDYASFIASVETLLRDQGLQHDNDGESVTEKIFFDMLVYRAVSASDILQLHIAEHLSTLSSVYGVTDSEYIALFGNEIRSLDPLETIQHIDTNCEKGTPLVEAVWSRFRSAYAKMQSTFRDLFPSDFYLDTQGGTNSTVKTALYEVIKKFQAVSVNLKQGTPQDVDTEHQILPLPKKQKLPQQQQQQQQQQLKCSGSSEDSSVSLEMDHVGDIFEYFLSRRQEKRANSRAMGQYFTPSNVITRILQNIDIQPGSKVLDYACGSAGFLVAALKKQPQAQVIGCEISTAPLRLAMLNLFFANKFTVPEIGKTLYKGDAFYHIPRLEYKVDIVLANPPFGIKVNIYDKTHIIDKSESVAKEDSMNGPDGPKENNESKDKYPIVSGEKKTKKRSVLEWTDCPDVRFPVYVKHHPPTSKMVLQRVCNHKDSEGMFLSLAISCLVSEGQAGIVFSHGILLRDSMSSYRLHLLQTCTVHRIYLVPRNVFRNTTIETCVVIFRKKVADNNYPIPFYNIQTNCKIFELDFAQVKSDPACRLFYPREHVYAFPENKSDQNYKISDGSGALDQGQVSCDTDNSLATFRIKDIAVFKRGDRLSLKESIERKKSTSPEYPCYGSGRLQFHTDTFNRENKCCKVARAAVTLDTCVMIIDGPFFCTDSAFTVTAKDQRVVLQEYLWYVLLFNKQKIYQCAEGVCQKSINAACLGELQICVARSIDDQATVVALFENYYTTEEQQMYFMRMHLKGMDIDQVHQRMTSIVKIIQKQAELNQKLYHIELAKSLLFCVQPTEMQPLGHLCSFKSGSALPRKRCMPGAYPVVGGGQKPFASHNQYNVSANNILCSTSGSCGYISIYDRPVWATDCFAIIVQEQKVDLLDKDFLYHFLKSKQDDIYKLKRIGKGPSHVHPSDLAQIKVPMLDITHQRQIVCNMNALNSQTKMIESSINDFETLKEAAAQSQDHTSISLFLSSFDRDNKS